MTNKIPSEQKPSEVTEALEEMVVDIQEPDEKGRLSDDDHRAQLTGSIERFLETFENSVRRWELFIYPALFAFILLAGYGFFLIYNLTSDMKKIALSLDPNMGVHMTDFSTHINTIALNIDEMTARVENMSDEMRLISTKMNYLASMDPMENSLTAMTTTMHTMNQSVGVMTANMGMMRQDMGMLNRNVSKPMNFMNSFMPW